MRTIPLLSPTHSPDRSSLHFFWKINHQTAKTKAESYVLLGVMFIICNFISFTLYVITQIKAGVSSINSKKTDEKIFGGAHARIEKYPYVVLLEDKQITLCTGSILTGIWVLTAAHCLDKVLLSEVSVIAGVDELNRYRNNLDPHIQVRNAESLIIHPDYLLLLPVSKHDIALIKVMEPFLKSSKVGFLQIDKGWKPLKNKEKYKTCTAVGWGRVKENESAISLQANSIKIQYGIYGCECIYRFWARRLLCAEMGNNSICPGDTGGPLICDGKGVGVAHATKSFQCKHFLAYNIACGSNTLGMYMFLCPYLNWIKKYVKTTPKQPVKCLGTPRTSLLFLSYTTWLFLFTM